MLDIHKIFWNIIVRKFWEEWEREIRKIPELIRPYVKIGEKEKCMNLVKYSTF